MVDTCSTVRYQDSWGFKREPIRPESLRLDYCGGMRFDDNFDWDNAWYDAMQINDNTLLLIGAPLYHAKGWINANVSFTDQHGGRLPCQFMDLDRVCYTALTVGGQLNHIDMSTQHETVRIPINRDDGAFNGRKAMVTLQKNNHIQWIRQWVTYHRRVHGIDGFLIYDNSSTDYTSADLEAGLADLDAVIRIVEWPYPYGPQGSDLAPWDSDYGQYAMLEHAKWRYLKGASLVLNNDIDEFIVTDGVDMDSMAQHLRNAQAQCLRYKGVWIEPYDVANGRSADEVPFADRRISDYYCVDPNNKRGIGYKWMLTPSMQTLNYQWLVHHVNGPMLESNQLFYAHYLALNTNWSWKRDRFDGDPQDLIVNEKLLDGLRRMGE